MKKLFIALAAIALIIQAFLVFPAFASQSSYILGDADGDGIVIIDDVTTIQMVLAELESDETGIITMCGDVDGNGLDISDATFIQMYLAEYENIYHINEFFTVTDPTKPKPTNDPYELPLV